MSLEVAPIIKKLKADKAKWATLTFTMALGLLLWGRLLLKDVPRVATATDPSQAADPLDLSLTVEGLGAENVPPESLDLVMPPRIHRDLFLLNPDYYERIDADIEKLPTQAKWPGVRVDDGNGQRQRVLNAAQSLTLQSTLLGVSPRALVNNQLLRTGQQIDGFELMEVEARQAKFKKDGVIVVLKMKTP